MLQHEREAYRLHARMPVHRRRLDAARRIIRDGLASCRRPYVAFSGGKDSAAMLHLVREIKPDIEARILLWEGESEHIADFDHVIGAWRNMGQRISVMRLSRQALSESRDDRWDELHADHDAVFVGLRAKESRGRSVTLRRHGVIYQPSAGPMRICPVAWMDEEDIGAIIAANDLPILSAYDGGLGVRTSSRVPRDKYYIRNRFAADLRERDPAGWARLCMRWPELRSFG